jgi:hypothetical protein
MNATEKEEWMEKARLGWRKANGGVCWQSKQREKDMSLDGNGE